MPRSWLNPVPDTRKGDRHKPRSRASTNEYRRSRWDKKNVVGWDGEGANTEDGRHVYNLLCNSNKKYIASDTELSTVEILEFFLSENSSSAINVVFSGGYDVNMILKDLTDSQVEVLWKDGRVRWGPYRISYRQRKVFSVAKYDPVTRKYGKSFVLWDVFGFYQSSFVKACRKWLVDDESIEGIDAMKQRRSEFTAEEFDDILGYCMQECQLLVLLVQELFKSLDGAGLRLSRFDGAGAIAGAMLRKNSIKDHIPRPPEDMYRAIQLAYAGGRIEACRVGNFEGTVHKYDINSAYPSACITLPSWKDAEWRRENHIATDPSCVATLVAVEWSIREERPFYPLFFRAHDGTILFPRNGAGIYWLQEFDNLRRYYVEGEDYQVLYAINVYSPTPHERPMAWIQDEYNIRLEMKRAGNMAQEAIKLGINSVYGKLAQQEGYDPGIPNVRPERFPTYHCLAWASLITATTRSRMYQAARPDAEQVVAFATDAVITTGGVDPGVRLSDKLGDWSYERYSGCTLVQAGVYWLKDEDTGVWHSKYRGFDPDSLYRDAVVNAWTHGDTTLPVRLTRFIGMGSALARTDFRAHWRHWETEERTLDLMPKGKRTPVNTDYLNGLCATLPAENVSPSMSSPYPVVWMDGQKGVAVEVDGVSFRDLETEWEESYL